MPGRRLAAAAVILLLWLVLPARAEPDFPDFSGRVVDAAHVLSPADTAALTRKLAALEAKTGVQFAVVTVPSLGGIEIEPYANELFRKWGIGQKGADNGLLLILAPNERKLRFEVGYGLEGTMTDAQSKLILRNTMVPKLKAGDPAGALTAGADDAIAVLTAKDASLPRSPPPPSNDSGYALGLIVLLMQFGVPLLILIMIIRLVRKSRRSGWVSGGITPSSGTGWSSDSGASSGISGSGSDTSSGSSSSDSFSGGGGGDSGGGGASDSY